jgi:hypothetical protein
MIRSTAMKVSTAPKKNFGIYSRSEIGSINDMSPKSTSVNPVTRDCVPDRIVKIV